MAKKNYHMWQITETPLQENVFWGVYNIISIKPIVYREFFQTSSYSGTFSNQKRQNVYNCLTTVLVFGMMVLFI